MKILNYLSILMIALIILPVMFNQVTEVNEKVFLFVNLLSWGVVNIYTSKKINK